MEQYRLLAECLLPAHIISLNQECARISLQFTEHKKEEAPPPKKNVQKWSQGFLCLYAKRLILRHIYLYYHKQRSMP